MPDASRSTAEHDEVLRLLGEGLVEDFGQAWCLGVPAPRLQALLDELKAYVQRLEEGMEVVAE